VCVCTCVRVCGDVKWFGHWPSIMERSQVQFPVWNFGVVARILLKILQCTKLYKLQSKYPTVLVLPTGVGVIVEFRALKTSTI